MLNGQRVGSLWRPPYRLDVSNFLKPGENHIEIRVYNTALNAWSKLPPHDYKPLIEKYGDRIQMQDLDKVQPIPSGILGAIHLVTGQLSDSPPQTSTLVILRQRRRTCFCFLQLSAFVTS